MGDVDFPIKGENYVYDIKNIFDVLAENRISFGVYYGDFPIALYNKSACKYLRYYYTLNLFQHVNNLELPAYTFIEPNYYINECDGHPLSDIRKADNFLANIYEIIRNKKEIWENCLFIVTFDEHGGFYDNVDPSTLGPRIPTLLISPYIKKNILDSTIYDSCSVLKFILENYKLDINSLTERVSLANTINKSIFKHKIRKIAYYI